MATTLFFRSTQADWSTGHNDTKLNGSASEWLNFNLSTTRGAGATTSVAGTVNGPVAGVEIIEGVSPVAWISPPLDADITIAGSVTWNLRAAESNMSANASINGRLEVVDGATGAITLIDQTARTTELGVTTEAANNFAETPAAGVACKRGDRLRVRVFAADAAQSMAAGFAATFWYDGPTGGASGDSFLTLTETLTFVSEPAGTQIFLTDTASAVSTASVDREAWTSRGAGAQTDVRNTAAGWTAPLQMTDTAGGTVVDWFTKPLTAFTLGGAVRCNIRGLQSNVSANAAFRVEVAVTANDGTGAVTWGATTYPLEAAASEAASSFLVSGDDTAVSTGQRLRIRVLIDDSQDAAMATGHTVTLYYAGASGGSGDTFLTFSQTLTVAADTINGDFTLDAVLKKTASATITLDAIIARPLLTDTFGRTLADSWGTSDSGTLYQTVQQETSVGSGFGVLDGTTANPARITNVPRLKTGLVIFDFQTTVDGIDLASQFNYVGVALATVDLDFTADSLEAFAGTIATTSLSPSSAVWYRIKALVGQTGEDARIKVWDRSTAEPDWQDSATTPSGSDQNFRPISYFHSGSVVQPLRIDNLSLLTFRPDFVGGAEFVLDAVIAEAVPPVEGSFTLDAVLKRTESFSFIADAAIRRTESASATLDAVLRVTREGCGGGFQGDTFQGDTFESGGVGYCWALDAVLHKTFSATATLDAVLRREQPASATFDAALKREQSGSSTLDAQLTVTINGSLPLDSILRSTISSSLTADAIFRETISTRASYRSHILDDSPIAYWRLGESSGTAANDEVGIADGTYINTPTLGVSGLIADSDTAVAFARASGERVTVAGGNLPAGGSSGASLECWFNLTSEFTIQGLVRWGVINNTGGHVLYLNITATAYDLHWQYHDGTAVRDRGSVNTWTDGTTGQTYHVVVTHDYAAETITFYLNGEELGTEDVSTFGPATVASAGLTGEIAGTAANPLDGTLDEPAIYSYVLTPTQVATHYAIGTGAGTAGPVLDAVLAITTSANAALDAWFLRTETRTTALDAVLFKTTSSAFSIDAVIMPTATIDAVLRRTQAGSFALDAVVMPTTTLDAILRQTIPGAFTLDAFVAGVGVSAFSLDAVLFREQSATWALDAVLRRTESGSFDLSAVIQPTIVASLTFDAVIQGSSAGTFSLDATVLAAATDSLTVDAVIRRTESATITLDAFFLKLVSGSATVDAVVLRQAAATFTLDAFAQAAGSAVLTLDAVLLRSGTGQFTLDASVASTETNSFTLESVLFRTETGSFSTDAIAKRTASDTLIFDAILDRVEARTFTFDAVQLKTTTAQVTIDSVIRATRTAGSTLDSVVRSLQQGAYTLDALLYTTFSGSFTLNATVVGGNVFAVTLDAVIQAQQSDAATIDAVLRGENVGSFDLSAMLAEPRFGSASLDAILRREGSASLTADAVLQKTVQGQLFVDGILRATHSAALLLDAFVPESMQFSFTLNACTTATHIRSFATDAYLIGLPLSQVEPIHAINSAATIHAVNSADTIYAVNSADMLRTRRP